MSQRHKAEKAVLSVGTSAEWNDDHIPDFTDEISQELLPAGFALASTFNTAQTSGGSAPVWALVAGHSFVVLNTGATTDQTSSMRLMLGAGVANVTHPDDLPILTAAVDIAAVHDAAGVANSVVEFGFQDDSDALFTVNQHCALFRVYDGDLYAVTGDGVDEVETLIAAYNQYGHYRIEILSSSVKFYVDNMTTAKATHVARLPAADLTVKFSVRSKNNINSTIRVDAAALVRLRSK